ncbi:3-deoxy-7-phosphoheptulonate synthase [Mesorhizobium sp. M00.F.Ca.ET.216.01.1.1]|uniref:3-deoxy-7-phosphoheptulonate synthase n=1 Tax=Mesorhizobium sp. M00.F.Ca.ET.216.01.1.1 TaxID=2500528 RepID=UPI000FDB7F68|nr:3-deoxy-7-phosphoheptulonate synthase [Mesorhizobium sp. M00.F.Ca.ET.216.01.1.1]TGQ38588.1 3-deoxy-7-phosphoheptulonate synthase [Mesorhizobium sp. M00.F.Ca.ET.216.01.1.1]TJW06666.1 MAG: 3-deoxy-7-phosphoheptulonate synthase [Mesorhizobium sp.]TJW46004.1 MAG: 3-deoxy-7-phosphoheptulonate synthase [Mesorhizobium sp.]
MLTTTDDLRVTEIKELSTPEEVMREIPRTLTATRTVAASRNAIHAVLTGADDRLVVVVGPCSIHDPAAAVDYASRLAALRESLSDRLEIVMRVYFEKPRTTVGWKGLINDPDLDGRFAIDRGLRLARSVLSAVNNLGLPAATEFLDMATPQYIADLVAWGAIGARTTESQIHRELASGLSCPVGFKNGTDGNLRIAAEAVKSAAQPHHFMAVTKGGRSAIAATTGNEDCHVILRGGIVPNYDATSIAAACAELGRIGVAPRLMIDVSHANSNKKPENQPKVATDVAGQVAAGDERIIGVMIESNLVAGRQDVVPGKPLVYGQSITDGCIDWATTETVLHGLADAVERRRSARRAMIASRPGAA